MANLVAAFGSSHSTMLFSAAENWQKLFDHIDRKAPIHDFDGIERPFDEHLANTPPEAAANIAPDLIAERHRRTMAALDRLEADIAAAELDALIIVGDDQREIFKDDCRPAIAVYCGETIRNAAAPSEPSDDWYVTDQRSRLEDGADRFYPCDAALGLHLAAGLTARGFDITAVNALPVDRFEGHAYSFVHRRLMDRADPVPIVPIFLNTYYPPNQPTPERCHELGRALRDLIAGFGGDARIGLFASGGLSHFLVNEPLDEQIVAALKAGDLETLSSLPLPLLEGGASEIRNWIAVAAASTDLSLDWIEYVPAYRSKAMTGVGLGFAGWK
ncbi:MAG: protocatechuate 3,4-dioxygenase [Alphaproteobacteria bacterium]|jgi:hypothetical protein